MADQVLFSSGMRRDSARGKINYWLTRFGPMLRRWAIHLTKGAEHYEKDRQPGQPRNWMLASGLAELERGYESATRHFEQWLAGATDEDHAAAVYFNINLVEYIKNQLNLDQRRDAYPVQESTPAAPPAKPPSAAAPPPVSTRTKVYISGPMSLGDRVSNLAQALSAYRSLADRGYAPLCPQLTFFAEPFLTTLKHSDWLEIDLPWVKACDAVLRLPGESVGADLEVKTAQEADIPVYFDLLSLFLGQPLRKTKEDSK